MKNILTKYKEMTNKEKKELAKKILIGTGIGVTGFMIGRKMIKSDNNESEIKYLEENITCLESDNFELEDIIDRQTLKIKEHIDTINSLKGDVKERDLSIMELVDGEPNRYRAIRSGIWNDEEKAKRAYDIFVRNTK